MRSSRRAAPRRPLRSARALLAGVALLGLGLTGCSQAEPGVVAYVDDTKITERQVDDAVAGATEALGQPVSTEAIVNVMIHGQLSADIAAERQLEITDAQRAALLKDSNLAPLLNVPAAVPLAYDAADQQIVGQTLGEGYLAEVGKRPVTLNPRFGVLDLSQKLIVTDQSGGLARPAAPSPTP